jgi:hypothetical protein
MLISEETSPSSPVSALIASAPRGVGNGSTGICRESRIGKEASSAETDATGHTPMEKGSRVEITSAVTTAPKLVTPSLRTLINTANIPHLLKVQAVIMLNGCMSS